MECSSNPQYVRDILWKVEHGKQNLACIPFSYKTMNENFYDAYK